MSDTEFRNIKAKERFRFLSLRNNLSVQRAWLLITEYMSKQIAREIESQLVDDIFDLKDTDSFEICRHEEGVFKEGDIIFHVPMAVTNVSPSHYAELFKRLNIPIVSIGQTSKCFCSILTVAYKPIIDLLVSKEVAMYYSEWIININPEQFTSSYSIPIYLYIIDHIQNEQIVYADFPDLSQALSAGKYEYFSDFEKRILKPVKADFDKGLLAGANPFTFDYEKNRENNFGKKSKISLALKLLNYQDAKYVKELSIKKTYKMETTNKYEKYIQLLETNKNLILTGAPGTGKTFMAKELAKLWLFSILKTYYNNSHQYGFDSYIDAWHKDILDYHCEMVQFHPSYDYTDFVEGLRPVAHDNAQLHFELRRGIFKNFCGKALSSCLIQRKSDGRIINGWTGDNEQDVFCECYGAAMKSIKESNALYKFYSDEVYHGFSVQESDETGFDCIVFDKLQWQAEEYTTQGLFYEIMGNDYRVFNYGVPSTRIVESYIKSSAYCGREGLKNIDIHELAEFYRMLFEWIVDYAKHDLDRIYIPCIFIIDEINRGEISKIFGELFYSIDPDYRGKKGLVQTQYQNMIEDDDIFKNGFFVPENVYIIGTMNDIDRSLESMDFAMGRRFAFVEVTAEESYQSMIAGSGEFSEIEKKEIKKRMFALNDAILKPELRLGKAYQIGAAYFRKYLYYKHLGMEQAFAVLWDNHLKGLFLEYLRGNQNAKDHLYELEKAYNK